jgi:hypothetical protein
MTKKKDTPESEDLRVEEDVEAALDAEVEQDEEEETGPQTLYHGGMASDMCPTCGEGPCESVGLMGDCSSTGITVGSDPVSGNPVPAGSSPAEVRDDIPALLSEGEYVIPADVVRYHGLKTFQALRMEAKMGLMSMAFEGQIQSYDPEEEPEDYETEEGNVVEEASVETDIETMDDKETTIKKQASEMSYKPKMTVALIK